MTTNKSYCITFRPKNGLTEETEAAIIKWLEKQDYYVAVTEKEGVEKHLHAQIWMNSGRARGEICTGMTRIGERTIKDWDNNQKHVCRSGVRIAYSDWYDNYLLDNENKGEAVNELTKNIPNITGGYYPSIEEQEARQASINAVDQKYHRLKEKYMSYIEGHDGAEEVTMRRCQEALAYWMYVEKSICVIEDQKRKTSTVREMYNYIRGTGEWQTCATLSQIEEDYMIRRRAEMMNE